MRFPCRKGKASAGPTERSDDPDKKNPNIFVFPIEKCQSDSKFTEI